MGGSEGQGWHRLKLGLGLQNLPLEWLPHVAGKLVLLHEGLFIGPLSGFPQSEFKAEVAES